MPPTLRIGVLIVESAQLLDLSAIDLLYMTDPEYLRTCEFPAPLYSQSRATEFHYIGSSSSSSPSPCQGQGPETPALAPTTAQLSIKLTASLDDEVVSPGKLDILFIPGPDPAVVPGEEVLAFIRAHDERGTTVMSVCTGAFVVGYSGIGRGRKVTGPRMLVGRLREKFPDVGEWDSGVRWVRDGNLWSSGGITNGHDLVAEYLRQNYPGPIVNTVLAMADVVERPVKYDTAVATDMSFFVWQVLKSLPRMILRGTTGH